MIVPHPPVLLSQIRVNDIWLLLAIGGCWEFICRMILLLVKGKPKWLLQREEELFVLQQKTAEKRKLGPPAFVETSKLERQVLAVEKDLSGIQHGRKTYVCRACPASIYLATMYDTSQLTVSENHHQLIADEPKPGKNVC